MSGEEARAAALTCCCRSGRPSAWRPRCTGGTRGHLLGFRNGSAELSLRSQVKRKRYHHITCPGCNPQVLASGEGAGTPPGSWSLREQHGQELPRGQPGPRPDGDGAALALKPHWDKFNFSYVVWSSGNFVQTLGQCTRLKSGVRAS